MAHQIIFTTLPLEETAFEYQEEQSDWMNLSVPGFKGNINVNLKTSAKAYLTLGPDLVTQAVKLREVK